MLSSYATALRGSGNLRSTRVRCYARLPENIARVAEIRDQSRLATQAGKCLEIRRPGRGPWSRSLLCHRWGEFSLADAVRRPSMLQESTGFADPLSGLELAECCASPQQRTLGDA